MKRAYGVRQPISTTTQEKETSPDKDMKATTYISNARKKARSSAAVESGLKKPAVQYAFGSRISSNTTSTSTTSRAKVTDRAKLWKEKYDREKENWRQKHDKLEAELKQCQLHKKKALQECEEKDKKVRALEIRYQRLEQQFHAIKRPLTTDPVVEIETGDFTGSRPRCKMIEESQRLMQQALESAKEIRDEVESLQLL